jgi:hypothetical protein
MSWTSSQVSGPVARSSHKRSNSESHPQRRRYLESSHSASGQPRVGLGKLVQIASTTPGHPGLVIHRYAEVDAMPKSTKGGEIVARGIAEGHDTFRIARSRRVTAKSQAASIRPEAAIEADSRWARVLARACSADEQFWYSVATTGSTAGHPAFREPQIPGTLVFTVRWPRRKRLAFGRASVAIPMVRQPMSRTRRSSPRRAA